MKENKEYFPRISISPRKLQVKMRYVMCMVMVSVVISSECFRNVKIPRVDLENINDDVSHHCIIDHANMELFYLS